MEKIKAAVERARTQRAQSQSRPESGGASEQLVQNIEYSDTQVVQTDSRRLRSNRLITAISDESVRAAFKMLRTQVEQRMSANGWNACVVTCPTRSVEEAKTTIAINLAISLAWSMHRTVLLVDLNLKQPRIHTRFGVQDAQGVIEYLVEDIPIKELLFNPGIDRLTVLPAGRPTAQSSELLSSPKMATLVDDLKSRYADRILVFDLPPLLESDDASAFIPRADCSMLVIGDGVTRQDELSEALGHLSKEAFLGVCLDGVGK